MILKFYFEIKVLIKNRETKTKRDALNDIENAVKLINQNQRNWNFLNMKG